MGAVERIAVIGAGTMGMQISALAAAAGYQTTLYDLDPAAVDRAIARIDSELLPAIVNGDQLPEPTSVMEARSRLVTADTLETAVQGAKEALESNDSAKIEAAKTELEQKTHKLAEKVYQAQGGAAGAAGPDGAQAGPQPGAGGGDGDDVIDAEFDTK